MKKNLDFIIILFMCLLVCGIVYIMYGSMGEKSKSYSGGSITFREVSSHAFSRRTSHVQNFDFNNGFTGVVSSSVGESRVMPSSSSYKYQGLLSARPAVSSKSLLSSQVTHTSTTSAHLNVGGVGASNFTKRSVSAPVAQPNISMPIYAQALKISPSLSVQPRSVSSADIEVARRSLVSTAPGSSSFSFSSSAYSSYQPTVYGQGITLSREGTLDYGTAYSQNRAKGQRRAGPPVIGGGGSNDSEEDVSGSWLNWLDKHYDSDTTDFNNVSAQAAYDKMIENWNPTMGPAPSYSDWLAWLQNGGSGGYTINDKTFRFPIGDIVPLILIALSYLVMMFVRKRKFAK